MECKNVDNATSKCSYEIMTVQVKSTSMGNSKPNFFSVQVLLGNEITFGKRGRLPKFFSFPKNICTDRKKEKKK